MVFFYVGFFPFFSFLRSFGGVEWGEVRFVMGLNCSINRVWFAGIGF